MYPKIENLKNLIPEAHPTHHPSTRAYHEYWKEQKRRCIEGYWFWDSKNPINDTEQGYRWAMPTLYFYGSMALIKQTDHKYNVTRKVRARIDDVEWIVFSAYAVCRGFSGFELADFTCHMGVLSYAKDMKRSTGNKEFDITNQRFTVDEVDTLKRRYFLSDACFNKDGREKGADYLNSSTSRMYRFKPYVDPLDAIKAKYTHPLGKALYESQAQNLFILGSRGTGKSYTVAAAIAAEILFDGAKQYDLEYLKNPPVITVGVGAYKADKSENLMRMVVSIINDLPGKFGSGSESEPSPLWKNLAGTTNAGSKLVHKYDVKEGGNWGQRGSGSTVVHEVMTVNNPEALAGYRCTMIAIDEVGLLPNVKAVHGSNEAVQITEGRKFGMAWYLGTGGNIDKVVESQYMFYRPDEYNMLGFEDHWEHSGKTGLFIPVEYTYRDLKDDNGNTIWELATERIENRRKGKKHDALAMDKMNYPRVPSDMFINARGTLFPQEEIQAQLRYLEANKNKIEKFTSTGELVYDPQETYGVKFVPDTKHALKQIEEFPIRDGASIQGCLTIYEHPPEVIPLHLYKVTYDPYRDDNIEKMSKGVSLAAIYVHKAVQKFDGVYDMLVAHYVGRLPNVDMLHEIAIKISLYYNAKLMVEMNLNGCYKYCIETKRLGLLAPTPMTTIGKINPNIKQRYNVGIKMTEDLIIQAEQYLIRWLLKERDNEYDELGNIVKTYRNINYIYDKPLLQELLSYNRVINTDRVSALLLLMLWYEENKELKPKEEFAEVEEKKTIYTIFDNSYYRYQSQNKFL